MEDTITVDRLLLLTNNYTITQINALYGETVKGRHSFIRGIFDKAMQINDSETVNILYENYDMKKILSFDIKDISNATNEETEIMFNDISNFIKNVDPNFDIRHMNKRQQLREERGNKRLNGSISFQDCFTVNKNGEMEFNVRKYLFKTKSANVRMIAENLGCPKEKLSDCYVELIPWILKQPECNAEVIKLLRTFPDERPIPLEDILDIENGNILMKIN